MTSILGPRWRPITRPRAGEHHTTINATPSPEPAPPSRDRALRGKARRQARRQAKAD